MASETGTVVSKWRRTPPARRKLLLIAATTVARASAMVALLPFKRVVRFGSTPLGGRRALTVKDCVWAVEAASARLPCRTKCIEKGLAVQRMLRAHGVDARLHYGARMDPGSSKVEAHVWVSVDGAIVIGGEAAPDHAEIVSFP